MPRRRDGEAAGIRSRCSFFISLQKQQKATHEKLTELAKREAKVYRFGFEKEMEPTDRALKLAEVGKPKSNWELQGVLGLEVFVLGSLAAK